MNFSRRYFLGSLASAVAASRLVGAERPLAKVGILSDTHVRVDKSTVEPLLKAFRCFAAEGVGTVVISGDICEVGMLAELALVMDAWRTARRKCRERSSFGSRTALCSSERIGGIRAN